jgi:hypothetical protein
MKRVLFIAGLLEFLKYTSAAFFLNLSDGFLTFFIGIIYFIWFLPEMMIGGEHPPHHWYTILGRVCVGVLWNIPASLYISKCLPEKESERLLKKNKS